MAYLVLTKDQEQYQRLARDLSYNVIRHQAAYYEYSLEFPQDIYLRCWELGLMDVSIPEEYGGLGLGNLDACVIMEEIAAGCTGISAAFTGNAQALAPILLAGNDEQKKEFVSPMCEELSFAGYCFCAPSPKALINGITIQSKRIGSSYLVTGTAHVVNAGVARWFLVLAREDVSQEISAFVIPAASPGILLGDRLMTLGRKAADIRVVSFENVEVNKQHLLGSAGKGAEIAKRAYDIVNPLIAAEAIGLARSAMMHAIEYAKTRVTFGQAIANHQAISFILADMAKDIEAARLMSWKAAWLLDTHQEYSSLPLMARCYAADVAAEVAINAVQVLGGYGYSREYPVEKLMRDAKMFQIIEGTGSVQKALVGKELIK